MSKIKVYTDLVKDVFKKNRYTGISLKELDFCKTFRKQLVIFVC